MVVIQPDNLFGGDFFFLKVLFLNPKQHMFYMFSLYGKSICKFLHLKEINKNIGPVGISIKIFFNHIPQEKINYSLTDHS